MKCFSDMHQGKKIKSISVSLQRAARDLMDALAQIALLASETSLCTSLSTKGLRSGVIRAADKQI